MEICHIPLQPNHFNLERSSCNHIEIWMLHSKFVLYMLPKFFSWYMSTMKIICLLCYKLLNSASHWKLMTVSILKTFYIRSFEVLLWMFWKQLVCITTSLFGLILFFLVNAVYHTSPMAVPLLQPDLFDICKWEMQCYISLLTVYQFTITICYVCLQWR